jgi:hypothetical protein
MAFPYDPKKLLEDINYFRKVRNPKLKSYDEDLLKKYFRKEDYEYPDYSKQPPANIPFPGWPAPGQIQQPEQLGDSGQDFLNQDILEITASNAERAHWKGTKYLGTGGNGRVGLWEYTGPSDTAPKIKQIAVKEYTPDEPSDGFEWEGQMLEMLQTASPTSHVVTLLGKPQGIDAQAEGLHSKWQGIIIRLKLEFCEMGAVYKLIYNRITS